jgi:hypothetical protein
MPLNAWIFAFLPLRLNSKLRFRPRVLFAVIATVGAAAILYLFGNSDLLSLSRTDDQVVFQSELWPGEGVPRIAAKTSHLKLHREPSPQSRVARMLTVEIGGLIEFDESRYRTLSPGVITATHKGSFQARDLGKIDYLAWDQYYNEDLFYKKVDYDTGDSFGYLQYRAGLSCLISWQGKTWEVDICPWSMSRGTGPGSGFTIVSEPQVEWWIRVIDAKHNPLGWFLIDGETVELLKPRF